MEKKNRNEKHFVSVDTLREIPIQHFGNARYVLCSQGVGKAINCK